MKNVADLYHLTSVQRETLNQARPSVVQTRWRFSGELNSVLFERAWEHLLARHSMLRTCFLTQLDEPVQVVRQQMKLQYERAADYADQGGGFDPLKAPLFRVREKRLAESTYEFVLEYHPVLLDEQSVRLLLDEVNMVYRALLEGSEPGLLLAISYREYVAWVERQVLRGAVFYWRNAFASPQLLSSLKTPESSGAEARATRHVTFNSAQTRALAEFADRAGISLETLLEGSWALVLMREQNCNEVSVGVVAHERPRGLSAVVGLCANVLPLPLKFNGAGSTLSWLQEVERQRSRLQRYAHVSRTRIKKLGGD